MIPLLRDVRAGESADAWPILARCAWCKRRCVVRGGPQDELSARRAEALAFVLRGSRTAPSIRQLPSADRGSLVEELPPVVER